MAVVTTTKISQLTEDIRLDPEFYQPKYLESDRVISKIGGKNLGEIADIAYGTTPEGGIFEESGIPFLRSQNFSDHVVTSDYVFCSKNFHIEHLNSKCIASDILFAAIGATIGDYAIVPHWIKEANINQNIARVRITDKKFLPEYIWAFFLTEYGQFQLRRYPTGNAQPYLNTFQFNRFKIPYLKNQEKFTGVINEIFDSIDKANKFYPEAEQELLERMEWDKVQTDHVLSYAATSKDVLSDERLDPEFYQPKFENLERHLKKIGALRLGDFCPMPNRGSLIEYDENGEVFVINSKDLGGNGLIDLEGTHRTNKIEITKTENQESLVRQFDLIFYAIGAYAGRTNCYLEKEIAFAGNNVLIIRPDNKIIDPVYLSLFLNSKAGLLLSQKYAAGSAQKFFHPKSLMKYPVFTPRDKNGKPDLAWQKKLADKVVAAYKAKKSAKQKIEEAKRLVEDEIEKLLR